MRNQAPGFVYEDMNRDGRTDTLRLVWNGKQAVIIDEGSRFLWKWQRGGLDAEEMLNKAFSVGEAPPVVWNPLRAGWGSYIVMVDVDEDGKFGGGRDFYYRAVDVNGDGMPEIGVAGADEIQRCLEKVGHANFKVWYDAGNILHYTGKDPALEAQAIAKHVTGFCAKDCAGLRGEVMMQLGAGKVDFKAVLGKLKSAGFQGPILVEGIKVGATPAETTANARANRELLERVVKEV